MDISFRSTESELMDQPGIDKKSLKTALSDISFCNKWLGGDRLTINAVEKLIQNNPKKSYTILDVGCGDGEMLRKLAKRSNQKKVSTSLIGIDINDTILNIAREKPNQFGPIKYKNTNVLTDDLLNYDIVLCTLTLHHLKKDEIIPFLKRLLQMADIGVVINDLERSRVAHFLFRIFRTVFLKSTIAKNDGLVSIRRGFKRNELWDFAAALKNVKHSIGWKWAFRYVWILEPK